MTQAQGGTGGKTLEEVEAEVTRLRTVWGITGPFRFLRTRDDNGAPHIEGDVEPFQYVVTERGQELDRREVDADELMFITISATARGLASREELRTRRDDYSRGTWMDGHIRLMALLREDWARRVARRYAETLRKHPLSDTERRGERRLDLRAFGCAA